MIPFALEIPTKIHFGRNTFKEALKIEKAYLGKKALIITTGNTLERLGYMDEIVRTLEKMSIETIIFSHVSPNPELEDIIEAIKTGREYRASSVMGVGGGSAMDAAKAVACGMACEKPIQEYYYKDIAPEAAIPMIAIPTTAGTGSELSKGAILSDKKTRQKKGLRGFHVYPKATIVDSHFTDQIPRKTTLETGFDVFAHAAESFVSYKSSRFSEMLSLEAIKLVGANLSKLTKGIGAAEARDSMSYASMLMGINLGNIGTALPHRMQYPIGAATGTSHSAGLLALYPAWIKYEYKYSSEKLDRVASALTGKDCCGEEQSVGEIMKFIEKLNVRKSLKELGLISVKGLAAQISGDMKNDPAFAEDNVVDKIYENAFKA